MSAFQEMVDALAAAAQLKGAPLNDAERAAVVAGAKRDREYWRKRFLNVIRLAGYRNGAPERICDEWLDKYLAGNLAEFEAMLVSYEQSGGDPE